MKLKIDNKTIDLKEANTFFDKLIGLMFQTKINYCLRLKCNGIHTFFMKEKIDIILTDKCNNVLYIYENFKQNKILLPKKNVFYTYELPGGTIKNKNIKKIEILN